LALLLGFLPGVTPQAKAAGWHLAQVKEEEEEDPKKKPGAKPADTKPTDTKPQDNRKPSEALDLKVTLDLSTGPFNLQSEAEKFKKYPAAAKLLEDLSKAQDILTTIGAQGQNVSRPIRPLPERYEATDAGPLKFEVLGENRERDMPRNLIVGVDHYEYRALKQVSAFVQEQKAKPASAADKMPAYGVHRVAEMILSEVSNFHQSAISRKQRRGNRWEGLAKNLEREVFSHQLAQIDALTEQKDWGNAYALCEILNKNYAGSAALEQAIERVFVAHARSLIDESQNFLQARLVLKKLKETYTFRTSGEVRNVEDRLKKKARDSFLAAQKLKEENKRTEMFSLLEEASQAWPDTAGLREFILKEQAAYPVLIVGVRHLPQQMSPTTAATDAEKMAARLIFEPLVNLRSGPSAKEGYIYKLGDDLRRIDQGYEIVLPPTLKWSDGTPVRSADVLRSWELAAKTKNPLYDIDIANVLEAQAPDDERVQLIFKRGVLDPFSYLTFPLVPVKRLPSDRSPRDLAFGKQPLGSGPFMVKSADDEEVVLVANPHYQRWHAPQGPYFKEIRFIRYTDFNVARKAMEDGRWQMLLDITTQEMRQMTGTDQFAVATPSALNVDSKGAYPFTNPRVWFLAPNMRSGKPLASENLRKAIGFAIDRDTILSKVFNRDSGKPHKPLNGPFPLDSWAYNKDYNTISALDLDKSSDLLKNARDKDLGGAVPTLSLKYPLEALGAKEACEAIRTQLLPRGITLKVEGVPQRDLARELARAEPNFDLVYWCYDFEDERLSLRPLFDVSGLVEDGRNYVGSTGGLDQLFDNIQNHRDLVYNQKRSFEVHRAVVDRMLLVPLWQIDTHVAMTRKLKFNHLHPILIFDHVELWTLE
jgi:ABC-type transport system substrate-binding protein